MKRLIAANAALLAFSVGVHWAGSAYKAPTSPAMAFSEPPVGNMRSCTNAPYRAEQAARSNVDTHVLRRRAMAAGERR